MASGFLMTVANGPSYQRGPYLAEFPSNMTNSQLLETDRHD